MKKYVFLIVAMLLISIVAVHAEGIDLSGMTTEELYALNLAIVDEISSRGQDNEYCFFPGEYIIGEEIDPGRYVFTCIRITGSDGYGFIDLRKDPNDNNSTLDIEKLEGGDIYSMNLSEGNLLKVDRIIIAATKTK